MQTIYLKTPKKVKIKTLLKKKKIKGTSGPGDVNCLSSTTLGIILRFRAGRGEEQ